jgi:hypothetical protein
MCDDRKGPAAGDLKRKGGAIVQHEGAYNRKPGVSQQGWIWELISARRHRLFGRASTR